MQLTKKEKAELRNLKSLPDSDDIRYKDLVKKKLLDNHKILYLLNNEQLLSSDAPPDEYFGVNIYPYYLLAPVQHNVQNYICYETQVREIKQFDKFRKFQQLLFYVICEKKTAIEKNTYIARHDLLAALIMDEFNWTNLFGARIHCVSNVPSVVDNDFICRTLTFEHTVDNNMAKTKNGITRMVNHDKTYDAIPNWTEGEDSGGDI